MDPAVIERLDIGDSQAPKGRSVLETTDELDACCSCCFDDAILLLLLLLLLIIVGETVANANVDTMGGSRIEAITIPIRFGAIAFTLIIIQIRIESQLQSQSQSHNLNKQHFDAVWMNVIVVIDQ